MDFKTKYLNCRKKFFQNQACSQVLRFGGQIYFYGGKVFCLYHMFETNFSVHKKNLGITAPECLPMSAGLGRTVARKSCNGGFFKWGLSCVGGLAGV